MPEINDPNISPNVVPASFSNIPSNLTQKGIYFWFADEEGLEKLLQLLSCKEINRHYIKFNGKKLFLIYIGTAGTGKQKKSHLLDRLKWHLKQKHTFSALKHKSLSNLRLAIGLLLTIELEGEEARTAVNSFMEKHLFVSWKMVEKGISEKEKSLIQTYFPFINDRHNTKGLKASKEEYATKSFKELKAKYRANLKTEYPENINKEKRINTMENKRTQTAKKDDSGCFLIVFKDTDNLHEVVNKYEGLGDGPVLLEFKNFEKQSQTFYINKRIKDPNKDNRRKTGDKNQDIYKYFSNIGSTLDENGKELKKWQEVQIEMAAYGIKNAILKICPQDNSLKNVASNNSKPKNSSGGGANKTPATLKHIDFERMKGTPKLLILPCSDSKMSGGENLIPEERIDTFRGNEALDLFRQARLEFLELKMDTEPTLFIKTRNGQTVTVEYFQNTLTNGPFEMAYKRYKNDALFNNRVEVSNLLNDRIEKKELHVLFISGLFGVVNAIDQIPDYHLTITDGNYPNSDITITDTINEFCNNNSILDQNVFYMLSNSYLDYININDNWHNLWHGRGTRNKERTETLFRFLNNL